MKEKIITLLEENVGRAEDNLVRAQLRFARMTCNQLNDEYGCSGKTCREILGEYKSAYQEAIDLKTWFLENIK